MTKKSSAFLTHQYEIDDNQNGIHKIKKMRSIEIKSSAGKPIAVLQAEDNLASIEMILKMNGWKIVSWNGTVARIVPTRPLTTTASEPGTKGCGIGCLLFIVIMATLASCVALTSNDTEKGPSTYSSEIACEDAIRSKLNAPSTAKFSQVKIATSTPEPNLTFIIIGFVEAENKLGGIVGSNYRCTVEKPADGKPLVIDSSILEK